MRERLIAVLVGLTVAIVASYGIPRALFLADFVRDHEQREVARSAQLLAAIVDERTGADAPVTQDWLAGLVAEGEALTVTLPDGEVTAGEELPGNEDDITVTAGLADGGSVSLTRDGALVSERVSQAVLPIILIGAGLVLVSVLVGVVVARRLSRPFQELAGTATRLGTGRFDLDVPRYAVPEAEAIGQALRTSGERLERLVRREREFAVNASHELLTPITGIRLELEDVARSPQTSPEVAESVAWAVQGLDCLATRVRTVLEGERAVRREGGPEIDLSAATAAAVQRWRPELDAAGRRIDHAPGAPVPSLVPAEPVRQILDALIAQAHRGGSGTVTVDSTALSTHLRVRVSDEGGRRGDSDVLHRRADTDSELDADLILAAETAESIGGYVMLDSGEQASAVLMLPRREV